MSLHSISSNGACFGPPLTSAQKIQLSLWVQTRTGVAAKNPWTLHYKASDHGFECSSFHLCCDRIKRLLVICKSLNGTTTLLVTFFDLLVLSGSIFGGFSEVAFASSGQYLQDPTAFLFTMLNPHGISPTMLLSRREPAANAVFCCPNNGPSYGQDLIICDNSRTSRSSSSQLGHSFIDSTGKGAALFTGTSPLGLLTEILAFEV